MKDFKHIRITGKRGIDDLRSWSPYSGDPSWPCFSPDFPVTEAEYKADPEAYEKLAKAWNETYIEALKETGEFGKEYHTDFNFKTHPEFENMKPDYSKWGIAMPLGSMGELNNAVKDKINSGKIISFFDPSTGELGISEPEDTKSCEHSFEWEGSEVNIHPGYYCSFCGHKK